MKPGVKAGMIAGLASIVYHIITFIMNNDTNMDNKWMSYLFMAFPAILGVWMVKKESLEGMSFAMGFKGAIQAALVCGIIYSIYFVFYIQFLRPEFIDLLVQMQTVEMEKKGLTDEQLEQGIYYMKKFMNVPMMISMSLIMYAIIGAVVGAIASSIMKNKTN